MEMSVSEVEAELGFNFPLWFCVENLPPASSALMLGSFQNHQNVFFFFSLLGIVRGKRGKLSLFYTYFYPNFLPSV